MIRAILPYILAVVVAFALAAGCYEFGVHVEHLARVAEVTKLQKDDADKLAAANKAQADAEQAARDTEARRAFDMAALDANYQKELSDAKTISDASIAAVRAGTVRVRDRFTCTKSATSAVPSTAQAGNATGSIDAAGNTGFQQSDVEFLLREAQRADAYARQVNALQDVVRKDRQ